MNPAPPAEQQPVAYWVAYWTDDYAVWTVEQFEREGRRAGGRVHGLFPHPVKGGSDEPVAYQGRHWTTAKDYAINDAHDQAAAPMWAGPVVYDPD